MTDITEYRKQLSDATEIALENPLDVMFGKKVIYLPTREQTIIFMLAVVINPFQGNVLNTLETRVFKNGPSALEMILSNREYWTNITTKFNLNEVIFQTRQSMHNKLNIVNIGLLLNEKKKGYIYHNLTGGDPSSPWILFVDKNGDDPEDFSSFGILLSSYTNKRELSFLFKSRYDLHALLGKHKLLAPIPAPKMKPTKFEQFKHKVKQKINSIKRMVGGDVEELPEYTQLENVNYKPTERKRYKQELTNYVEYNPASNSRTRKRAKSLLKKHEKLSALRNQIASTGSMFTTTTPIPTQTKQLTLRRRIKRFVGLDSRHEYKKLKQQLETRGEYETRIRNEALALRKAANINESTPQTPSTMMGKLFENRKVKAYRQKKKELAKYLEAYREAHAHDQSNEPDLGAGLQTDQYQ
jgi:hypothetical protein